MFGLPVLYHQSPLIQLISNPAHPPEWEPHLQMSSSWIIEGLWERQWQWLMRSPPIDLAGTLSGSESSKKPMQGLANSQSISGGLRDTPDKQNILLGLNTHQDFTSLLLWRPNLNRLVSTAVILLKYKKGIQTYTESKEIFFLFSMGA